MKILRLVLILCVAGFCVTGCGGSEPDYWDFYKPDKPEEPEDPGGPGDGTYTIKAISFNVRYPSADDGANIWDNRKKAVPVMFEDQKPAILGVQEAVLAQKTYMDTNCKGYSSIGIGRNDGVNAGEFMAIYFRTEEIKLEKWGTFWLSETPDVPSKGWDANNYRTATYATFTHKESGRKFFCINTHLDHLGKTARAESMKLIKKKMDELNPNGYPTVLMADFNTTINDAIFNEVKTFMKDVRSSAPTTDNKASYNGWGNANGKIDHVFCSGFTPLSFKTIDQRYESVPYISDHYPVAAVLEFPKSVNSEKP